MPCEGHGVYPASSALAHSWVEAWNQRDLDGCLELYHPDVELISPRVAQTFEITQGAAGSSDGVLIGVEALRDFYYHCMRKTEVHMELLHVMRGLEGSVAVVCSGENGSPVPQLHVFKMDQGRIIKEEVLPSM